MGTKFITELRCQFLQALLFRFSAQHDCRLADCQPTASRPIIQERTETSQTISLLAHRDDSHFVVNMAALHNATQLRRVLPRALTVPRPIYADRKAHHVERAAVLRQSQIVKRAETQEKRRATLAKKAEQGKARKVPAVTEAEVDEGEQEDEGQAGDTRRKKRKHNH
ncbi:hypothetical protein GGX14DRAFT_377253 [Mycena pura]|uniref:Uncharacterized protein n=1 Tax=Mycena pura TaxID=153505 RepID=A0AAD6UV68_9AGAR|nr:hypothetical protein GGX14DRAFT_377253 [Mycena pura]